MRKGTNPPKNLTMKLVRVGTEAERSRAMSEVRRYVFTRMVPLILKEKDERSWTRSST